MSINDDKRELLKLRQGLIKEEDSEIVNAEKPVIEKPTGMAAVENFVYHHKIHLFFGAAILAFAGIFAYFAITTDKPDISVLIISDDFRVSEFFLKEQKEFERSLEAFVPDYDSNGYVHAECLFIDLVREARSPDTIQGNVIKLFGEVQAASALLYVGNRAALEAIPGEEVPADEFYFNLADLYPDNPNIVDGVFLPVKGSAMVDESLGLGNFEWSSLPDDVYIVVRQNIVTARNKEKAQRVQAQALEVVYNIINASEEIFSLPPAA